MKRFFPTTLHRTVILIVFLAVLPSLGILISAGIRHHRDSLAQVLRRNQLTVQSIAEHQRLITENARTVLSALSQNAAVKNFDSGATAGLFKNLASDYPSFANIFLVAPSGRVLVSGMRVLPDTTLAGSLFLERAAERKKFAAVPMARSIFTKARAMQFVQPLYDRRGVLRGYLGAELRSRFFSRIFIGRSLPALSTLHVLDEAGFLAAATPALKASAASEKVPDNSLWENIKKSDADSGTVTYADPVKGDCIAAYQKVRMEQEDSPYLTIILAMPQSAAYASPKELLRRDMALLALAALCALAGGVLLCFRKFVLPLRSLLATTTRLRSGELQAESEQRYRLTGEFAELGREFATMAEALERRNRELEAARDTAASSSKAKSEFLANMSHEIRTPMNAILGMAYLVQKTELSTQQHSYLSKVLSSAGTLLRIVNDILDFSKSEAGKLTMETVPFNLGGVLNAVQGEAAEKAAPKQLRFASRIHQDVPEQLLGDPLRLTQALSILLNETISHSENTLIEFGCRSELGAEDTNMTTLHFLAIARGAFLDEQELQNMQRCLSDQDYPAAPLVGPELRLALCRRILHLMGGAVTVKNITGSGFSFTATARFALAPGPELPLSPLPASTDQDDPSALTGLRVLLVDDNSINRDIARELMESMGISVLQASGGREAVEICKTLPLPCDIVLMDLRMPDMDGHAATRAIRERKDLTPWRLPVIALTADSSDRVKIACLASGMNDFATKPIHMSTLSRALHGWRPISSPDAKAALPALLHLRESIGYALMNDNAPSMPPDGITFASQLNELLPLLHQGREEALRSLLIKPDFPAALALLNDVIDMAHEAS